MQSAFCTFFSVLLAVLFDLQRPAKKPRLAANLPLAKKPNAGIKAEPENAPITPIIRPPQPKESHLAALGQKRQHVKF